MESKRVKLYSSALHRIATGDLVDFGRSKVLMRKKDMVTLARAVLEEGRKRGD